MEVPQEAIDNAKLYLSIEKQLDELYAKKIEVREAIINAFNIPNIVATITENSDRKEKHEEIVIYGNNYIDHQVPIPETPLVLKWLSPR